MALSCLAGHFVGDASLKSSAHVRASASNSPCGLWQARLQHGRLSELCVPPPGASVARAARRAGGPDERMTEGRAWPLRLYIA